LRGLTAMLRTLEHNGRPTRLVHSWFERFAENPRFPASARAGFDARLDRLGPLVLPQGHRVARVQKHSRVLPDEDA